MRANDDARFRPARAERSGRGRFAGSLAVLLLAGWLAGAPLLAPTSDAAGRVAHAAPVAADAADFVPTADALPAGFVERSVDAVGGELEPTIALRRSFVSVDGGRTVDVAVSLTSSAPEAQGALAERANQLVRYGGWQVNVVGSYGDAGYRAVGGAPDGSPAALVVFRINSIVAEVAVGGPGGAGGPDLLDAVARLVERRMLTSPTAAVMPAGFAPPPPAGLPGRDPVVALPGMAGAVAVGPPGAEVTGGSSGSPIPGDTIVNFTVSGVDRPWLAPGGSRLPVGMEYLTVEIQIDVNGQTEVVLALTDFWVSTFDGRSWTPVSGRTPAIQPGTIALGTPARGWLTFMVPADQPALQLSWRLRTTQSLATQSNQDQTLVVPLTAGATASASVGTSAPPAGVPVVPPSSAPPGPTGPSGPSGPSAPTPVPTAPSAPSGPASPGGGSGRGGTRLQ